MMIGARVRHAIDSAAAILAEAGIDSARRDAEELAAHLAGSDRGQLAMVDRPDEEFFGRYRTAVIQRARRVPLQHLIGSVQFGPVKLRVGPGVFIPRPETEAMLEWATAQDLSCLVDQPLIVDVCTGSGALALALAQRWPTARILGVDDSEEALTYARQNCVGSTVELLRADVTAPGVLAELDGRVDLMVANPPYVPDSSELEPEVSQHDPHHAVFGGPDGMTVITAVVGLAARLLHTDGLFAVEHDDSTSQSTVQLLTRTGFFDDIVARTDFTGRLRFVTARRGARRR